MIVRTEAIVLRRVKYGETSLIVTLFTRALGTVAVMARGARGPKSKFGSALEPMSHVQAVLYHKPSREVHTLSEVTHLSLFKRMYREIGRMAVGIRIVETVTSLFPRPEADETVFESVVEALRELEQSDRHWINLLPYSQLQMCAALGFSPMIDRETVRRIGTSGGYLSLENGSISEIKPTGPASPASRRVLRAIGVLIHADRSTSLRMELDKRTYDELLETVESYMRYHFEDYRPSRSKTVFTIMDNRE